MSADGVTFGQAISKARKGLGLSQKELAARVMKEEGGGSISPQYLNDIEHDRRSPTSDHLIKQFADDAGKKGGEFYTPHMVVQAIVEVLAPTEGMRICDPTCGSGGMLVACAEYIERRGLSGQISLDSVRDLIQHGAGGPTAAAGEVLAVLQDGLAASLLLIFWLVAAFAVAILLISWNAPDLHPDRIDEDARGRA